MKQEFNTIDEIFRAELNDYSPELPGDAWDKISISLAQTRQKKEAFLFSRNWKIAATIALLVSTGSLTTYVLLNKSQVSDLAINTTLTEPDQNTMSAEDQKNISTENQPIKSVQQKLSDPKV